MLVVFGFVKHFLVLLAMWLPGETSENGPVHLDEQLANMILCKREDSAFQRANEFLCV